MEINDNVKNMSVDRLDLLRLQIKQQRILGMISEENFICGDLKLINLIIKKRSKVK